MDRMNKSEIEARWNREAAECLLGRTVVYVRYMTEEEAARYDWFSRPVMIKFDNGLILIPATDDEGNDAGALFMEWDGDDQKAGSEILPVLR
jgi:hypothetical protein